MLAHTLITKIWIHTEFFLFFPICLLQYKHQLLFRLLFCCFKWFSLFSTHQMIIIFIPYLLSSFSSDFAQMCFIRLESIELTFWSIAHFLYFCKGRSIDKCFQFINLNNQFLIQHISFGYLRKLHFVFQFSDFLKMASWI